MAAKKKAKRAKKKTAKRKAAKRMPARKPAKKESKKKKSRRKPGAAFMRPVTAHAGPSGVVGARPMPRTELTKKLWQYIKANRRHTIPKAHAGTIRQGLGISSARAARIAGLVHHMNLPASK